MNIYEFVDSVNFNLVATRYPNQKHRFTCSLERAEIKEGGVLRSAYGQGKSFLSALKDYVAQIRGKTLVFNAYSSLRYEVVVPKDLSISQKPNYR